MLKSVLMIKNDAHWHGDTLLCSVNREANTEKKWSAAIFSVLQVGVTVFKKDVLKEGVKSHNIFKNFT